LLTILGKVKPGIAPLHASVTKRLLYYTHFARGV